MTCANPNHTTCTLRKACAEATHNGQGANWGEARADKPGLQATVYAAQAILEGMMGEKAPELDYHRVYRWCVARGSRPDALTLWALAEQLGVGWEVVKGDHWPESAMWGDEPTSVGLRHRQATQARASSNAART